MLGTSMMAPDTRLDLGHTGQHHVANWPEEVVEILETPVELGAYIEVAHQDMNNHCRQPKHHARVRATRVTGTCSC